MQCEILRKKVMYALYWNLCSKSRWKFLFAKNTENFCVFFVTSSASRFFFLKNVRNLWCWLEIAIKKVLRWLNLIIYRLFNLLIRKTSIHRIRWNNKMQMKNSNHKMTLYSLCSKNVLLNVLLQVFSRFSLTFFMFSKKTLQ